MKWVMYVWEGKIECREIKLETKSCLSLLFHIWENESEPKLIRRGSESKISLLFVVPIAIQSQCLRHYWSKYTVKKNMYNYTEKNVISWVGKSLFIVCRGVKNNWPIGTPRLAQNILTPVFALLNYTAKIQSPAVMEFAHPQSKHWFSVYQECQVCP